MIFKKYSACALLHTLAVLALFLPTGASAAGGGLNWQPWRDDIFARATAQNKLVILDLEAVWCHWCHVMEEKTYGNPLVAGLLKKSFITVRADQDAAPDLSMRYGDWGWPATILFAPDGTELAKLSGYIPAPRMASLLEAFIADPTPGPSVFNEPIIKPSASKYLTREQRAHLIGNYNAVYDAKNGGWGQVHKFIHAESMDYALKRAADGDDKARREARQTLDAALALIDPEWGGVYQYSDKEDWSSPHFEKIMSFQAQYLRQYSQAYALWGEARYLDAARRIYDYLTNHMLSGEGAFFTSQDADASRKISGAEFYRLSNAERLKLGVTPRTDTNLYARENGWAISGLVAYYNVTADKAVLDRALKAANWVLKNRALSGGGFSHGASDRGGPFLGDTLAMGQASLDLYMATGERKWLEISASAARYIAANFKSPDAGFWSYAKRSSDAFSVPVRQHEENIYLARFANLLHRTYGAPEFAELAQHTMRYLASPGLTSQRRFLIGVVLVDDELSVEPAHITIVGRKDDTRAQSLHKAARSFPALYKRVDWWDKREGALPNPDVQYPEMEEAAAFACANQICSLPVFEEGELAPRVMKMLKKRRIRPDTEVIEAAR